MLVDPLFTFFGQGADGGRGGIEEVDLILLHDLPEAVRLGIRGDTFEHKSGGSHGERPIDQVAMPRDPPDVGGAPVGVFVLDIEDLRPPMLDDLGLMPALRWLVSGMVEQHGVKARLEVKGNERRFTAEAELILFRIIQEALRNVGKHSGASKAQVRVEFGEDKTKVSVTDNGRGFELAERVTDLARTGKLGLAGIEERARLLGGSLRLHSELGKGAKVEVEVPI